MINGLNKKAGLMMAVFQRLSAIAANLPVDF